jgi:hypothetical protein
MYPDLPAHFRMYHDLRVQNELRDRFTRLVAAQRAERASLSRPVVAL